MVVTEQTYTDLALSAGGRLLELHGGVPREKPPMTFGHNQTQRNLHRSLLLQLDPREFDVSANASRVRQTEENYFIPDLFVIPVAMTAAYRDRRDLLEVYVAPLPLVVEIWSPSTGDYDIDEKIPEYRTRGDLEIWRIQPFERTLTAWRKRTDGSYEETVHRHGTIAPIALPGVTIDLDALFAG